MRKRGGKKCKGRIRHLGVHVLLMFCWHTLDSKASQRPCFLLLSWFGFWIWGNRGQAISGISISYGKGLLIRNMVRGSSFPSCICWRWIERSGGKTSAHCKRVVLWFIRARNGLRECVSMASRRSAVAKPNFIKYFQQLMRGWRSTKSR